MAIELPDGPFGVIYADPPWSYDNTPPQGNVQEEYDTMTISEIQALDVPAGDDCVLYLWATVTHAQEAFDVLEAWGFEYKTQAVWKKERLGVGYWFRGEHELLYVGTRGDASPPDPDARRSSVFSEPAREHSRKPEIVRTHIEQAHPDARKLEMFARDGKTGWELWGDETPETKQATQEEWGAL